ncbi:TPA: AbiH family protein [Listeria monocytogenes]|nr:hypothetical protein [Listeria monocytogenes]EAG1928405.1 hypothetical protein [Listeria monocytogenes]
MKVAYIIGNGFDISMGLKTSYSDFYNFIREHKTTEQINNNCLYKNINANIDLWKDFEIAMGLYTFINTKEFDEKLKKAENNVINNLKNTKDETFDYALFNHSFQEFNEDFLNYIENQERLFFRRSTEDETMQIINGLADFSTNITTSWKKNIAETMRTFYNDTELLEIDIINFNYTNTLGYILDRSVDIQENIIKTFQEAWGNKINYVKINEIHIHGEIQEGSAIGVNDLTQINMEAIGDAEEAQNYVKQHIVNSYDDKRIDRAKLIIDQCDFIIIFGCSLGSTDKIWWEYIIQSMERDQIKNIILHDYDKSRHQNVRYAQLFNRENEISRNKLMKFTPEPLKHNIEEQNKIKRRIFPVINGELFTRKNSQIEEFVTKGLIYSQLRK